MTEFSPLTEQDLPAPIQLERVLSEMQIEYLDVDEQRLYVIYAETVLEVRVRSGTLDAAHTIGYNFVSGFGPPGAKHAHVIIADSIRPSALQSSNHQIGQMPIPSR